MTDRISKSRAKREEIRAWATKQGEPFGTADVQGRFNLCARTAMKYLKQLADAGAIREVRKDQNSTVYARAP